MDSLQFLLFGFEQALQPHNLIYALIGATVGTLVGILPGIGPVAGTAILIPLTFGMPPTSSIIMLAAIFYGAMYGGTLTSVLVNVPGEAASAVTCLDGYAMARKGRAGAALAIAAIGSFVGGILATAGLVVASAPLASIALRFGPVEFFALMVLGLTLVIALASRSYVRAFMSAVLGLIVAMVGIDPVMGAPRFTFGQLNLLNGIGIVPVAMGLFGISEMLIAYEGRSAGGALQNVGRFMPSREETRRSLAPIARGTGIGFLVGLIPGVGAIIPSILSYVAEKRLSKTPEAFGTGMIEGVAGPETANNAYATSALIPLFTLGIPGSPTIAVLMGAFLMNGIIPGPLLFTDHPDVVWPVIASLCIGNLILLALNLPLVPLWISILRIPTSILNTFILCCCIVGAFSINNSIFDVGVMLVFGVLGYAMRKLDFPLAPMLLTVVLAPMLEQALRQSLTISGGSFMIFLASPLAVGVLLAAGAMVALSLMKFASPVRGQETEV